MSRGKGSERTAEAEPERETSMIIAKRVAAHEEERKDGLPLGNCRERFISWNPKSFSSRLSLSLLFLSSLPLVVEGENTAFADHQRWPRSHVDPVFVVDDASAVAVWLRWRQTMVLQAAAAARAASCKTCLSLSFSFIIPLP